MVGTNNRYPVRMLTEAPRRNAGSFFSVLTFVGGGPSSGNQVGLTLLPPKASIKFNYLINNIL